MKSILKLIFCISSSVALAHGETVIGKKSVGKVELPESFHRSNEGKDTLFVMPRKDDMEGPVSMRITVLQDLKKEHLPQEVIKEILLTSDENEKLDEIAGKLVSFSSSTFKDPAGIEWILQHRSIYSEGILFTMTIGTIKGREKEPQCKELNDKVNAIIATLARQEPKPKKAEN